MGMSTGPEHRAVGGRLELISLLGLSPMHASACGGGAYECIIVCLPAMRAFLPISSHYYLYMMAYLRYLRYIEDIVRVLRNLYLYHSAALAK